MRITTSLSSVTGVLLAIASSCSLALAAPGGTDIAVSDADAALRARYAIPASRYMEIDGTQIHYADEGSGPAILLLHGSFSSLRSWNQWAETLRGHYRVVRFDLPPAGLSGSAPDGDNGTEKRVALLYALTRRLGIDRFTLVATSSSGIAGAAFAAQYPDRLTGLIYSNASVGPVQFDTAAFPPALKAAVAEDRKGSGIHKPEFWRQILLHNFVNKELVTPDLVREWTDLNNRPASMPPPPAAARAPSHDRTPEDLTHIMVPTLFLWSANDLEATLERDAAKGFALLAARDKALVVVPRCGHMIALECGPEALRLARPFIDRVAGKAARP